MVSPISTSIAALTADDVVSWLVAKKRQMWWPN
jgi:hypothetical protein